MRASWLGRSLIAPPRLFGEQTTTSIEHPMSHLPERAGQKCQIPQRHRDYAGSTAQLLAFADGPQAPDGVRQIIIVFQLDLADRSALARYIPITLPHPAGTHRDRLNRKGSLSNLLGSAGHSPLFRVDLSSFDFNGYVLLVFALGAILRNQPFGCRLPGSLVDGLPQSFVVGIEIGLLNSDKFFLVFQGGRIRNPSQTLGWP